jgi:hypothetical protein
MTIDFAVGDRVRQLRKAGVRPPERLVEAIQKAGVGAVQPLLALATEVELLHEDESDCYGPIHALRLLGELPSLEIITPLMEQLPVGLEYPDEELPKMWATDVPQIIGRIGAPAIEPLWAIVDDDTKPPARRGAALITIVYATRIAPEQRDEVVAQLRERLNTSDDPKHRAYLVMALGDIGVRDIYATVLQMYREGQIDQSIFPARHARQLLLTEEKQNNNVHLTFWERYDTYGPYGDEE